MTRQTGANAARVGILVIIATMLLYAGFRFLGGRMGKHGARYFVRLTDAGGIVKGTRVSMAGVHIGEVEAVRLRNPRLVQVEISIEPRFPIPTGSVAEIPTQFISLGESGMVIVPPDVLHGDLDEGAVLEGRHPGPLDNIFPDTKTTIQTLTELIAGMRDLVRDEDLKGNIKHLLVTTSKTLDQFEVLAKQTNTVLAENQGSITTAMRNASLAMADVQKSSHLLYKMMNDGRYQDKIAGLLKSLDSTTEKAGKLMDSLNSYVNDPAAHDSLKTAMDNAVAMSEQGKQIAIKTNAMADNGIELTKHGVELTQHAVVLTDQAGEVAIEAKALLKKLEGLVDKVEGKVDNFNVKLPKSPIGAVHGDLRAIRDTKPNYNRVDANLSVPIFGQPIYFGLWDAFASNRLNLQLGKQLGQNAVLRYGAHAGTEGLGVDYSLAPRLGLSADVFIANKPRFDALAKYDFGNGYDLWLGFDRIFDRNGLAIGVGIHK